MGGFPSVLDPAQFIVGASLWPGSVSATLLGSQARSGTWHESLIGAPPPSRRSGRVPLRALLSPGVSRRSRHMDVALPAPTRAVQGQLRAPSRTCLGRLSLGGLIRHCVTPCAVTPPPPLRRPHPSARRAPGRSGGRVPFRARSSAFLSGPDPRRRPFWGRRRDLGPAMNLCIRAPPLYAARDGFLYGLSFPRAWVVVSCRMIVAPLCRPVRSTDSCALLLARVSGGSLSAVLSVTASPLVR